MEHTDRDFTSDESIALCDLQRLIELSFDLQGTLFTLDSGRQFTWQLNSSSHIHEIVYGFQNSAHIFISFFLIGNNLFLSDVHVAVPVEGSLFDSAVAQQPVVDENGNLTGMNLIPLPCETVNCSGFAEIAANKNALALLKQAVLDMGTAKQVSPQVQIILREGWALVAGAMPSVDVKHREGPQASR